VGVRPEQVSLAEGRGDFSLPVEMVEILGADTLVHGEFTPGVSFTVRLAGGLEITPGERLELKIKPDQIHLFEEATGKRIN